MTHKREPSLTRGQSGDSVQPDPNLVGWLDREAHPASPAGGGGPGGFTESNPPLTDTPTSNTGREPGPLHFVPMQTGTPTAPNAPPATKPRSLGTQVEDSSELMDVKIDAKVLADGTSSSGVLTSFTRPASQAPGYGTDGKGKITEFKGKFKWRGTIEIQTVYGPDTNATLLSCYGRGTTTGDVRSRDITLGFHEHQHQVDFADYLSNNTLPDVPEMKIGMTEAKYKAEIARFKKELPAWFDAMKANSEASTDEVGHHKSTWESSGKCFVHQVP